jgi:phosphatidylglycerophosphate synthase
MENILTISLAILGISYLISYFLMYRAKKKLGNGKPEYTKKEKIITSVVVLCVTAVFVSVVLIKPKTYWLLILLIAPIAIVLSNYRLRSKEYPAWYIKAHSYSSALLFIGWVILGVSGGYVNDFAL